MKKIAHDQSHPRLTRQHEGKLQERRHERKAESEHLDGLKRILQSKLDREQDKLQVA